MGHPSITFSVLQSILTPLVRFCVRNGVTYNHVADALKTVFIAVAASEVAEAAQKVTNSQLSIITGIARKEIKRITDSTTPEIIETPGTLVSRVIGRWEQDPKFCTRHRKAKILKYDGPHSEFAQLVATVSKDIHPSTLLQEMMRIGIVTETAQGIKLSQTVHYQHKSPEKVLNLVARDFETLGQALSENVFVYSQQREEEVRNLHLRTEFDNIFVEDIPLIRNWLLDEGTELHRRAREFLAKHDGDLNPKAGKVGGGKVVLGAFSWTQQVG